MEDEIKTINIDLGLARNGKLDESSLAILGANIKWMLGAMFGGSALPVNITGTRQEVRSFSNAMSREKKYIETAAKYGLDNPRTYKNKFKLRKAVDSFQRTTGLKWPFKG